MHERFLTDPRTFTGALNLIAEMREALGWQEDITKALCEAQEKWVDDRKKYEDKLTRIRSAMEDTNFGEIERILDER